MMVDGGSWLVGWLVGLFVCLLVGGCGCGCGCGGGIGGSGGISEIGKACGIGWVSARIRLIEMIPPIPPFLAVPPPPPIPHIAPIPRRSHQHPGLRKDSCLRGCEPCKILAVVNVSQHN